MSVAVDVMEGVRRFRPYPEYTETGLSWLPAVPRHWRLTRLKNAADVRPSNVDKDTVDGEQPVRLCNYTDVYYNDQILSDLEFMQASASVEEIRKFTLAAGDVLITKDSETPEDIAVPAHVEQDLEGVLCGYHLTHIRPDPAHLVGSFVARGFVADGVRDQFRIAANGITRFGLSLSSIANSVFPAPPPDEQRAIAEFLDRETGKIDALVAKKERLIELLQEKRTALITHAVTKGLDPTAPAKHSSSDFFPRVPDGWVSTRVRYLCRDVADGPHFSPKCVDDGVMFISARNVKVDGWSFDDAKYVTEEDYYEFSRRIVPKRGDVLYTKGGTTGVARAVDFDGRFQVWVHIAVLKLRSERADPFFLAYALNGQACYEQSQLYTRGATNNDLGLTRLINIELAVPPLEEQRRIVNELDRATSAIDELIARVNEGSERLREFRTALISAAVTGKIDVREEAA